jgi:AcrR family transcriptional regulator
MVRRVQRAPRTDTPVKSALLDTTERLLDDVPVEALTLDAVLETSGISRGSLYYHFDDFPDLVEQALVRIFSRYVDESIAAINAGFQGAASADEFAAVLGAITRSTQDPARASIRLKRAVIFANSQNSDHFRQVLGSEQQRLTSALASDIAQAQDRGWVNPALHPRAIAAFIQAYTLGRIVDDIDPTPVPPDAWIDLIDTVTRNVMLAEHTPER